MSRPHNCKPRHVVAVGTARTKWTLAGDLDAKGPIRDDRMGECQKCGRLFNLSAGCSGVGMPLDPSVPPGSLTWWEPEQFELVGLPVPQRVVERSGTFNAGS